MANNPRNSNQLRALGREKFDLNLRPQGQICEGKQAHAEIAEIDAKGIDLGELGEYLHARVEQLTFPAAPLWFAAFENHRCIQTSAAIPAGIDYRRSVDGERFQANE
jgi:hypothetical protein